MSDEIVFEVSESKATRAEPITLEEAGLRERDHLHQPDLQGRGRGRRALRAATSTPGRGARHRTRHGARAPGHLGAGPHRGAGAGDARSLRGRGDQRRSVLRDGVCTRAALNMPPVIMSRAAREGKKRRRRVRSSCRTVSRYFFNQTHTCKLHDGPLQPLPSQPMYGCALMSAAGLLVELEVGR